MFVLKFLCLLIFTFSAVKSEYPPQELLDMLKPLHDFCADDAGVSEDVLRSYVITNQDHNVKCYMACIMKQSNWMSTTGEIKYDFIVNNPWEPIRDIVVNAVNQCRNIELIDDECQYIYNFAKCLYDVDTEHWFLP